MQALHVTLVFLGHRPADELPRIADAAFDAVAGLPAASLRPRAITAVPERRPRLFALDLDDVGGRARALESAVSGGLAAAGVYRREPRVFWPHVTLARVKRGRTAPPPDAPLPGST